MPTFAVEKYRKHAKGSGYMLEFFSFSSFRKENRNKTKTKRIWLICPKKATTNW